MKVYIVIRQAPYALPENEVVWMTLAEAKAYVGMQEKLHRGTDIGYVWDIEELEMPLAEQNIVVVVDTHG